MGRLEIGVVLPGIAVQRRQGLDLATAAQHAEDAGLDGVWHGDHLATGTPSLDCAVGLATAAAATTRIRIGASVFIPAIRPLAWAAKQVAALQYVSGGRLVLGVGSGGGPEQWAAAGVPYGERGARTDTALELLPRLLSGEPVRLPHGPEVELSPAVPVPEIWVGNASPAAVRRAARLGTGWFPSLVPDARVADGAARLADLAAGHGRPAPVIALGTTGVLGTEPGLPTREEIAAGFAGVYGVPLEEAVALPVTGGPAEAAERLAACRALGVSHLVLGFAGGDWRRQCDLLAAAGALLD
ncbi:LLM class flavin-dependent oxidoreductase [Actinomadura craniellae]|uniref:LLM class flavin-dependent oxidoreductase n=1 Tax=Actinomadura craniellae TaxID=2231787 RepID=A0A365HBG3_9ACTN|nr:LLM class flavin-dependent oxidoreductase [Actinomadura craniellae]RAY16425.1 LLM class flavin-dependent oxidoreductase [Actinomadura craniellae]